MTPEQAAYLAGVVDGEGHLGIKRVQTPHYQVPRFSFAATITNTNDGWLKELQSWIGGRIYRTDSVKRRNRRPCYDLRLTGGEARIMLAYVQPLLRLKRRHAQVLLRYFEVAARRRLMNGANQKTDSSVLAELEALYSEMKSINLRGLAQDWPKTPRQGLLCRLDGCGRAHFARGYCKQHYKKYIERGGPSWHERACKQCGKPFVSKRSDAEFCSQECGDRQRYDEKRKAAL